MLVVGGKETHGNKYAFAFAGSNLKGEQGTSTNNYINIVISYK